MENIPGRGMVDTKVWRQEGAWCIPGTVRPLWLQWRDTGKGLFGGPLGSPQGPDQECPLGYGEDFEFYSKRKGKNFLIKQVKNAYLPCARFVLSLWTCYSQSGKLTFLGNPEQAWLSMLQENSLWVS